MRVVVATVGTTGDVLPFAALIERLVAAGHVVTAVSWDQHRAILAEAGAEALVAGPATTADDVRRTAAEAARRTSPLDQVAVLRDFHLRDAAAHYRRLAGVLPGHDLAIVHGIHSLAEAAARDSGLPWASAVFDPVLLPTASAPPSGMPPLGPLNRAGWWMLDRMLRRLDAPLRASLEEAGSASAGEVTMFRARSPRLHMVAASPAIAAVPPDLAATTRFTGAWVRAEAPAPLPEVVETFMTRGAAPAAVTFGSMAVDDPARLYAAVASAGAEAGLRLLVQLPDDAPPATWEGDPERVLAVRGRLDHRSLFPRSAAVVHHGGAGTTHAVAAAGVPQVVVPHIGDQLYWAARVRRLGIGPNPVPVKRAEAQTLAEHMRRAVGRDEIVRRAAEVAAVVAREDGTATAVRLLERAAREGEGAVS